MHTQKKNRAPLPQWNTSPTIIIEAQSRAHPIRFFFYNALVMLPLLIVLPSDPPPSITIITATSHSNSTSLLATIATVRVATIFSSLSIFHHTSRWMDRPGKDIGGARIQLGNSFNGIGANIAQLYPEKRSVRFQQKQNESSSIKSRVDDGSKWNWHLTSCIVLHNKIR